ncbi:MAG: fatty acid desaturase [Polyangiales bacterium]
MSTSRYLRYKADRRTLSIIGGWFALVAFQWIVAPRNPWIAAPLIALTCAGAFLGAVATHNAVHCPVFHQRWMNNVWQVLLTLTYGHPVSSYLPGHNLSHHRHAETVRDVMRTDKARFRVNLFNLLFFTASIGPSIMGAEIKYARFAAKRRPRFTRQLIVETVCMVVFFGALLALDWKKALLYVLLPWQYAAWGIVTMNLLQHDGTDATSPWNHSRNFIGSVINWFAFNNGYHTIHHLKPTLHWSLAPEEHARVVRPSMDPRLEEPSMIAYLARTYFVPGGRKNFDGTPRLIRDPGRDESWFTDDGPLPATAIALTADVLPRRRVGRR